MANFINTTTDVISTANVDADTDNPRLARVQILKSFNNINKMGASYGTSNGVTPLDSTSKIPNRYLPNVIISSTGNSITLRPNNDIVSLESILNLEVKTMAQIRALTGTGSGQTRRVTPGAIANSSNGHAGGTAGPVWWDGTNWKIMTLGANAAN